MSRRDSTMSDGPTWHPGSRDSQPPFVYDEQGQPQPAEDQLDSSERGRQPRALRRRSTSSDLRSRSRSSRTIRPTRRSSKAAPDRFDDGDEPVHSDADDEHDGLLRSRSSSDERNRSRSPADDRRSRAFSVAYYDFPSPPGHDHGVYPPSPTSSARTTRRISSVEAEKRRREQDEQTSWLASPENSSGSDDEARRAPTRPRSLVPFERESSEDERRRIDERLEEQKKLREARAPTSSLEHERAAAFLAAVQTHQAEREGRYPARSVDEAWRTPPSQQREQQRAARGDARPRHAVDAYLSRRDPTYLGDVDEDDAGAQSDGAPERERRAQRLNAAHRERLRRESRMHGRLRDGESLYDLEEGPLADYFDSASSGGEREFERRETASRRSGSRASSSRPRATSDTEHFDGMSRSLSDRADTVRKAMKKRMIRHAIRHARLGPKDLPRRPEREHEALEWVQQHECLTAGLVVLVRPSPTRSSLLHPPRRALPDVVLVVVRRSSPSSPLPGGRTGGRQLGASRVRMSVLESGSSCCGGRAGSVGRARSRRSSRSSGEGCG